jgi:hypothetical protein
LCGAIGATKIARRAFRGPRIDALSRARRARKIGAMEEALCALGAFGAKKSKRFVARLLRTDKVFVYFT